jgi:Ca2+-binding EF-hand superfamily protein
MSYSDFLAANIDLRKYLTNEKILAIFSMFDINQTGSISIDNFKDAFTKFGHELTCDDISYMMACHDMDKSQTIELEEFESMLKQF